MSQYEQQFDVEWVDIDVETAAHHAYGIGVAAVLGEDNQHHLDRLYDAMDTRYETSVVELAFEEGRRDARDVDTGDDTWAAIFDNSSGNSPGETSELPDLVSRIEMLDGFNLDRPEAMDLPEFLKRG